MKENLSNNEKNQDNNNINRKEFIKKIVLSSSIGSLIGTVLAIIEKNRLKDDDKIKDYINNLNNPKLKNEILKLNSIIKNNLENHKKIYEELNKEIKNIEKNIDKIVMMDDESEYLNYLKNTIKELKNLLSTYEYLYQEINTKLDEIDFMKINNQKEKEINLIIYNYLLQKNIEIQNIKLLNLKLQSKIYDIIEIILKKREYYANKKLV
jgi:hypothetical protein